MSDESLKLWQEKLDCLREEDAIRTEPDVKLRLLRELGVSLLSALSRVMIWTYQDHQTIEARR